MTCGKQKFSHRRAEQALLRAKIARALRGSRRRREVRTYRCPDCSSWHLTSKP